MGEDESQNNEGRDFHAPDDTQSVEEKVLAAACSEAGLGDDANPIDKLDALERYLGEHPDALPEAGLMALPELSREERLEAEAIQREAEQVLASEFIDDIEGELKKNGIEINYSSEDFFPIIIDAINDSINKFSVETGHSRADSFNELLKTKCLSEEFDIKYDVNSTVGFELLKRHHLQAIKESELLNDSEYGNYKIIVNRWEAEKINNPSRHRQNEIVAAYNRLNETLTEEKKKKSSSHYSFFKCKYIKIFLGSI